MIVEEVRGDVFAELKENGGHVLFAVNVEGYNDAGFAGQVSRRYWPELISAGYQSWGWLETKQLYHYQGAVLDKPIIFHAAAIHALHGEGWKDSPAHLIWALKPLRRSVPKDEIINAVKMGAGPVGQMQGAPVNALLQVLSDSRLLFKVWSL